MPSYSESFKVSGNKEFISQASKEACFSMALKLRNTDPSCLVASERFTWLSIFWPTKLTIQISEDSENVLVAVNASSAWSLLANTHNKWVIDEFIKALRLKISITSTPQSNEVIKQVSSVRDPKLLKLDKNIEEIKSELTENQALDFQILFSRRKKSVLGGVLLVVLTGAFGGQKFYIGQKLAGVLSILFCWTFIPFLISIFDACFMGKTIGKLNQNIAKEIAAELKGNR